MTTSMNAVLKHLHKLFAPPGGDVTDGELLARFVATRDEESFAALLRRHGPMVLSVCRRMLHHLQDAEDCFQATFLVLARKAAKVKRESVSSWLYAVAYRTALEARAVNARRRTRERQVQEMPHPEVRSPEIQDWRPWLDQELNRLPEKYRAAIVACDLEGRSRKEAARLLDLSEGTLSSRLARGRRLLAKRLAPYGFALPPVALVAALGPSAASAQIPAALLSSTTKAAMLVAAGEFAALSASSAMLMKGVMKSMLATKKKLTLGAVMIATALGASGLVYRASGQPASAPAEKEVGGKPSTELDILRREIELLKLKLEVVQEKQRTQEAELRTLRATIREGAKSKEAEQIRDRDLLRRLDAEAKLLRLDAEAKPSPSAGLLDNKGHLKWPMALRSEEFKDARQKVNIIWQKAYENAASGKKPDASTLSDLKVNLRKMSGILEKRLDHLTPDEFIEAHRFLMRLGTLPSPHEMNRESKPTAGLTQEERVKQINLQNKLDKAQSDRLMWQERAAWSERMSRPGRQYVTVAQAEADLARLRSALIEEAKATLNVLRESRDAAAREKAAKALEEVLQKLNVPTKQPQSGKQQQGGKQSQSGEQPQSRNR